MKFRLALKIFSFISFLFSYIWGIIFLLSSGDLNHLYVIALVCGFSIILFLFSHSGIEIYRIGRENIF